MGNSLYQRRASVRAFLPQPVPDETINTLLEAMAQAPSGGNCQPWHFYVVRNAALRDKLAACAGGQSFIAQAPVVFVVCAEPQRSAGRYGQRGSGLYCLQDTAAAVENLLLCAAENGLGACWCGAFDEAAVSEALQLPAGLRPVAVVPVGQPKGAAKKPKRRPLEEVATFLD